MSNQDTDRSTDKESMVEPTGTKGTAPSLSQAPASRSEVHVDDAGAILSYANFCRVTGTPEEIILEFGLNAQLAGTAANVEIKQRLVVNHYTAKRLTQALALSIQRHEATFGVLETDIQKRVIPGLRRGASPG